LSEATSFMVISTPQGLQLLKWDEKQCAWQHDGYYWEHGCNMSITLSESVGEQVPSDSQLDKLDEGEGYVVTILRERRNDLGKYVFPHWAKCPKCPHWWNAERGHCMYPAHDSDGFDAMIDNWRGIDTCIPDECPLEIYDAGYAADLAAAYAIQGRCPAVSEKQHIRLRDLNWHFGASEGQTLTSCRGAPVMQWAHFEYELNGDFRVYYEPEFCDDGSPCGFSFLVVERVSGAKQWQPKHEVEVPFYGWAAHDGVRHLWPAEYLSCPDLQALAWAFAQLAELERAYCQFADINYDPMTRRYAYEQEMN